MIRGAGTIANYGSYISNCTLGQRPYKIPVNNLQDVQLFIDIGGQPDFAQYQLIHTCGPNAGTVEELTTSSYVIGQKPNDDWYGVFKSFDDTTYPLTCFVIAITLTFGAGEVIYFSEEYCIDNYCSNLTLIKGCYGNLDNKISYGCDGVYFGRHASDNTPLGDPTVYYQHQTYLRDVEVTRQAIKNTFKQGRTRNFRTEKEKIFQFWAELIPEWYVDTIDAIFYRGEVFVGSTKRLVDATNFELVDDCTKTWKLSATFKESCFQSFSCEEDPCAPPSEESSGSGGESGGSEESSGSVTPPDTTCYEWQNNGGTNANGVSYIDCTSVAIGPVNIPPGGSFCSIEITDFGTGGDLQNIGVCSGGGGGCTQYANLTGGPISGVAYTDCHGVYHSDVTVINAGAICVQDEPFDMTGGDLLTNLGPC